jgi:hypothetical protein
MTTECLAFNRKKLNPFKCGLSFDVAQVANDIWLVSFMDYDLGF